MKNFIMEHIRELDFDVYSLSRAYLAGILGALTVFAVVNFYETKPPKIGTINITGLVDEFEKQETRKNISPDILKQDISAFGAQLEKEVNTVSKKYHLLLLPSQAVISGSVDYTDVVRARIFKKLINENA